MKTWEVNWVATDVDVKEDAPRNGKLAYQTVGTLKSKSIKMHKHIWAYLLFCAVGAMFQPRQAIAQSSPIVPGPASPLASALPDGQHDFDFNLGSWKTHISRLERPLTGSTSWTEYDGISIVSKVWDGRANLIELEASGPAGQIEGMGLRLYNPATHQWSLNWANSLSGQIERPNIGQFKNGRGEFFDYDTFEDTGVFVRNSFSDITATSSRFEQAFSPDGGKTWETNWIMIFEKIPELPDDTGAKHAKAPTPE